MLNFDFEDLINKTNEISETNNLYIFKTNIKKLKEISYNNQVRILEAKYLIKIHHIDKALKLINEVISQDKKNIDALIIRGRIYMAVGEKELGCNDFKAAYDIKKDDEEIMIDFSKALLNSKRYEEAREIYKDLFHCCKTEDVINLFQSTNYFIIDYYENIYGELNSKEKVSLAKSYFELNKLENALEIINSIDDLENNYEAMLIISNIYTVKKQIKKALYYAEKIIEVEKNNPKSYLNMAKALQEDKNFKKAIEYAYKAIEIDENYKAVYNRLANLLISIGEYEEGLNVASKAETLNYDKEVSLNIKGKALFALGRYEEARESYNKAIAIFPKYLDAYINKSVLYRAEKNYREAFDVCEEAISLGYQYERLALEKGIILREVGQYNDSLEWIDWALEINSEYPLGLLSKAVCLCYMKDYAEAEKILDDLEGLASGDIINICAKIFLEISKGKKEESIKLINDYVANEEMIEKARLKRFIEDIRISKSELKSDNFYKEVIETIKNWI